MKTIFLTGGGGSGTIAAAKALKESGKYRVILGDMDKWAAGLRFADRAYILPAGRDVSFVQTVKDIIAKEKVDVFVPLVDEEILRSYELAEDFPALEILLPDKNFAKLVLDKWLLVGELKGKKFPYPETFLASQKITGLKFPVIVKPRRGRGSRNVFVLNSYAEIDAYAVLTSLPRDMILVQERVRGREFTVSVVVNKRNEILAVVPKEVKCKRGPTIVAVTRQNPEICELCAGVVREFKPNGPFNIQLMLRDDGVPVIFEMNPRYSTTIALTIEAGVNEIDLVLSNKLFDGKLAPFKEDLVMSRYYEQLYFEEKQ